jgi:DNA-binding transcriptional LysR family regulator
MHLKEIDANLLVVLDSLLVDGSVTKAAERLGRSPSAISHALAKLREIFQDELFVRAGQKLVATSKANEIAPSVHVICAGIRSLLRPTVPFDPRSQERTFAFASSEVHELVILRALRQVIRDTAAEIDIEWRWYAGQQSLEALRHNHIQFVISEHLPASDAADFVWQRLYDDRYVTIAAPGHPCHGKGIGRQRYADLEHVLVSSSDGRPTPVETHFKAHGVAPSRIQYVTSLLTALTMVMESDAVATVPKSLCSTFVPRLGLVQIRQPFPELRAENYLGWHRSQGHDECHEWLRRGLTTIFDR